MSRIGELEQKLKAQGLSQVSDKSISESSPLNVILRYETSLRSKLMVAGSAGNASTSQSLLDGDPLAAFLDDQHAISAPAQPMSDQVSINHAEQEKAERYLAALPIQDDLANHSLREALISVATGQASWRDELATNAQELIEAHKKALADAETQRDKKALEIMCAALREQGIEVEPIAETMYVEGGDVYFRHHDVWDPGYYARLRIQPARNRMDFQMVRTGAASNDKAMEEHFCDVLKSVISTVNTNRDVAKIVEIKQAGTEPMTVISSASIPAGIWQNTSEPAKGTQPAAHKKQVRSLNQR
ncbi:MAG: hypothetical protein IPG66_16425 [Hydrogenophilales bacterium]|nr:hypothetical protein [Hydrogenophilales bacterium]